MSVCPHDETVPVKKRNSPRRRCAKCGMTLSLRYPRRASKAASGLGSGPRKRRLVKALIIRDGPDCHWCGCTLTVPGPNPPLLLTDRTIDHVIPWSLGGTNFIDNLVLACSDCNQRRGNSPAPPADEREGGE